MDEQRIEKECPYCGEKILVQAKKCRFCNEIVDPALRAIENIKSNSQQKIVVIDDAGRNISITNAENSCASASVPTENRSRATYIVFGLFFGGLGIHNFYAGYSGRGVAQLLITLLTGWLIIPLLVVGVWVIIEICTVQLDAEGKKLV